MNTIVIFFILSVILLEANEIENTQSIFQSISTLQIENKQLRHELSIERKRIKKLRAQIVLLQNDQPIQEENSFENRADEVIYFKACAFRVEGDTPIYDDVNGNKIATWDDQTSFTSNQRVGDWIKITGYFIDKVWRPATQGMWVESSHVLSRSQQ